MNRQRRLGDPGFRFIGFGVRRRGGRIKAGTTIVVKYYFVRKRSRRLPSCWRVPPEVRVRLKRGRRFISLRFPTDVEVAAQGTAGKSFNTHESVAFNLISYVPQFRPGPADTLPPLSHLLHVETTVNRGFPPGTSGSAWTVGGKPVAIQVGGNASNQYREGYGQVLEYILDWARTDVHRSCEIAHVF